MSKIRFRQGGVIRQRRLFAVEFTLSAMALALTGAQAFAADQARDNAGTSNVMTVTGKQDGTTIPVAKSVSSATKTDTPIIEIPQSVSVVNKEQIKAQNAQTVAQALRYTAGVRSELRGDSTAGAPYLFSRGFYLEQLLDGSRMPSDTSFGYAIANFDPYGLERIEILHGPASVLYGQVNPGGVANLVSKRPTETPVHEVFTTVGSHNRYQAGFDLGGKLTDDGKLLYRLTGTGLDSDTQVKDTKQKRLYIAPAVTWRPNDDTSLTVLAKYQHDPDVGYYNFVPAAGSLFNTADGKISSHTNMGARGFDSHSRTQFSVGYEFEHRLNDVFTLRQNTHYSYVKDDLDNVFSNGFVSGSDDTVNRYAFFNNEHAKVFTIDNQVLADFATGPVSHSLLTGVDFQRILYRETVGLGAASTLNVFSPDYGDIATPATSSDDFIRQKQLGAYSQDQMSFGNWRYLLGMREDWADADDVNPVTASSTAQSSRAFTWRTGLVYLFDNGIAPYASFAKSFTPQVGELFGGGMAKPTTANQYEVGVKYQPTGSQSFATASLFDLTEENVLTADPENPGYSTQAGKVRSKGLELEEHAHITDNLQLIASYTYLHAVTVDSNDSATTIDGDSTPMAGKRIWGMPRNTVSTWLDYSFHNGILQGFGTSAGVRYLSASYDTSNTIRVPSVTLFDAGVHYDTGQHWLLSLNAMNLLDRHYVASCYSANTCTYGDGAQVLATARYRW
ncbi:TonB-dependent siderophore receptor [Sodalis sp. dw_96]|uniref:TonB-dependent siderophore receptor n=1 Tax=Sodalis sp. dw_96 TaxID=2719794 RepID=UPI001BD2B271|nr:TonB-dependent siderophore receptor [Sodalis sp. dw_96]